MSDWTAVNAAIDTVSGASNGSGGTRKSGESEMTPTRPDMRARESTMRYEESARPRANRDGSAGSMQLVRKTIDDFKFGATLGEGSYSTVSCGALLRHFGLGLKLNSTAAQVSLVTDKHPPYRSYALKILDKDHIKRERKTKYVLIERDTLKMLDGHPGIVRLYWTFQDQRSLCESP